MPNWCYNRMTIECESEDTCAAIMREAVDKLCDVDCNRLPNGVEVSFHSRWSPDMEWFVYTCCTYHVVGALEYDECSNGIGGIAVVCVEDGDTVLYNYAAVDEGYIDWAVASGNFDYEWFMNYYWDEPEGEGNSVDTKAEYDKYIEGRPHTIEEFKEKYKHTPTKLTFNAPTDPPTNTEDKK